jgi:NitT/TauT family transport system ATP-binding protein
MKTNIAQIKQQICNLINVNKVYESGTIALENINLTVENGDFLTLVGPSGCGKSTVLKLIAGLSNITGGKIENHHLNNSELAFVFQEAALMPWSTVLDNIMLPLKLTGISVIQAKIKCNEVIQLVGLEGFENAYPRQLSGGMKMRVSIARALVNNPNLMLMDEPFAALDEMTRSKLNSDILSLWQKKHLTVIFVTHNIYEAVYMSNRVLIMTPRPGKIIKEVKIEAPYPRTSEFRTSRLCNDYCREILSYFSEFVG